MCDVLIAASTPIATPGCAGAVPVRGVVEAVAAEVMNEPEDDDEKNVEGRSVRPPALAVTGDFVAGRWLQADA